MSDTKFTIGLDFKGKEELNSIIAKLLQPYNIDAKADFGTISAEIDKSIISPMRKVKTAFMEWGLVIDGIQGAIRTVGVVYDKTMGTLIKAAQAQESAEMRLKGALRATGMEVEKNALRLAQFASQMQKATTYGDEMLMNSMAQMQNIGRFDSAALLEGATKAAIGLSAAFGIDLGTAMDLVGKAGVGNTSMLGRYGIVPDDTASQAEKFNQVLSIGAGYFGIAEDQAKTSAGSMEQLKNTWGDFQETLAAGVLPTITKLTAELKPLIEFATAMSSEQKTITLGLLIMNALMIKHTLAVMANRAAFAALTMEQQRYVATVFATVAIQKGVTIGAVPFSAAMKGLGASFVAAGSAVKGFLLSIGPLGWLVIGITAAYAGLSAVLKVNTKVMSETYDAERALLEQKKEQISKSQSEEKTILKLTERYQQLAGQAKRNKTEQQELAGIHQKLADKYPSLISTTGSYSKSLGGVKEAAEQAKKALADLSRQQWQMELKLAKNSIESNRIKTFETLAKEFNWRDMWLGGTRGTALRGVKEDMDVLLNNDSSVLSLSYLKNLAQRLEDLGKRSKSFNAQEKVALQQAALYVNLMLADRERYDTLLKEGFSQESKAQGSGAGPGGGTDNDKDNLIKRLEDFRILQEALFNEETAAKKKREIQYQEELKLLGNNEKQKERLRVEYLVDVAKIGRKYMDDRAASEKKHYDEVKFLDSNYYKWKKEQLEKESFEKFPKPGSGREAWLQTQTDALDKEKSAFDNKPIADFESAYDADMSHLAELQQLGLITYSEISAAAWGYYNSLKAIVEADGEVSEAEDELLQKYLKRAEKAQLAVNRDSDLASYYNQVKFLDANYYKWKKARIIEDVQQLQISTEQRAKILKKYLEELEEEQQNFTPNTSIFDRVLSKLDVPNAERNKIKDSYALLASQISSIWSQMYANLDSQKTNALKRLEGRAKNERKSEAWLASEKEKINEQYEKKVRSMKRIEQKMQIASGLMNTFEGVTNALTMKPAWLAPIMAASIGALGLANVGYIAAQKFAQGGSPKGLFHGKGTSTSDSNLIAISDEEYIIAADRVRRFGVTFFDALNFGDGKQIRNALSLVNLTPTMPQSNITPKTSFGAGGYAPSSTPANQVIQVTLQCDSRVIAKAVAKGNKKIIRIN